TGFSRFEVKKLDIAVQVSSVNTSCCHIMYCDCVPLIHCRLIGGCPKVIHRLFTKPPRVLHKVLRGSLANEQQHCSRCEEFGSAYVDVAYVISVISVGDVRMHDDKGAVAGFSGGRADGGFD